MSTKIEWTDETWNPTTGCSKISAGCSHCYAERMSKRLAGRFGYPHDDPFRVTLHLERLEDPLHWKKPKKVFVCSMGDLFHESVPFNYIAAVFGVMAANPRHTFQVLTKRPKRMMEWFDCVEWSTNRGKPPITKNPSLKWPLPNVWLGVTAENQEAAEARIPWLIRTPAEKRFVSCEPLLGPIDFTHMKYPEIPIPVDVLRGGVQNYAYPGFNSFCNAPTIDQVIVGAETGPGKRPMDLGWARYLHNQCFQSKVPFFFKRDSDGNRELGGRRWEEMPK